MDLSSCVSFLKKGDRNGLVQRCRIKGERTILVPYRKIHVPKYHDWMKNPKIRELTASEPLTLEEEYVMQKSWQVDENKFTFIVLHKELFNKMSDEVDSMVGDVNLFISQTDEDGTIGEIEVMIAVEDCRGQGLGYEASLAMLSFGIQFLNLRRFYAKIGYDNIPSQRLFKKFLFVEVSRSDIFREVTLRLDINEDVEHHLSKCFYISSLCTEWYWEMCDYHDDDDADDTIQ